MLTDMSTVDEQVAMMRRVLAAGSDAKLADLLGYTRANVAAWRKRGAVPAGALERFRVVSTDRQRATAMAEVYAQFTPDTRGKGLCLAIFLAPSLDAVRQGRFSEIVYGGVLQNYADHFREIEVACTEEVARRMAEREMTPTQALESLSLEDVGDLYDRMLQRAYQWRYGTATDQVVHDKAASYRSDCTE